MYPRRFIPLVLVVITLAVFGQVRDHGFLWDDDINISENSYLNPVTLPKLLHFWQKPYERLYIPLTYTVWGILAGFSEPDMPQEDGLNLKPRPFHIANLILHALSVLVVFVILRLLVANDWAAGGGALLFALHPLQVEPVAWATGMKDLLCGFFSLVAVWQYLAYAKGAAAPVSGLSPQPHPNLAEKGDGIEVQGGALHYSLAFLAFVLALLAKPTAVAVPLVAWALDRWALGRSMRQSAVGLGGWLAAAAVLIIITTLAQPAAGAKFITPLWARPLVAGDAAAFYLYKLVFPFWLGPDYGRSPEWVLSQSWTYFTWVVPLGLAIILWRWRDRWPLLIASAGIFIAALLPVSGLIPFDFQRISTVADRYLYLSMLGPALALAWLIAEKRRMLVAATCALVLGLLGVASVFQAHYWRDATALFSYALTVNSNSWLAYNNLGNALAMQGELKEAVRHYRRALEIDPAYAKAHNNLGIALALRAELGEAVRHYRRALEIDPAYAKAHNNFGVALAMLGEFKEAMGHFRRALEVDAAYVEAHFNLGNLLARGGELEEAIRHYRRALEIDPKYAKAHNNLGIALAMLGDLEEAIGHFRKAVRYRPDFAEAHESLARALVQQGKKEEAIEHYQEALRIMKSRSTDAGTAGK